MVDEAHGAGVLGARGAGTAELLGVEDRVDLRMGTFSKSLASCGGFIAGPADVVEYLRIQSRAFLFTAAAVPAALGAALAALRVLRSEDGPPLLAAVLDNARYLRDGLEERGFDVVAPQPLPGGGDIVTPIVPVAVGDDWKAGPALARPLRRRRLRQHRAAPRGAARRRAAADVRDGDPRPPDDRPGAWTPFPSSRRDFEAEHGPLPGPHPHSGVAGSLVRSSQTRREKNVRS